MRKVIGPLALALALVAAPALAETFTHKVAKVTFEIPDNWKSKGDGDSLTVMDKKEDTAVAFVLVDSEDLKTASKRLDKNLSKKIKNLTWKKEEKVNINGMKGIALEGDGESEGKNIDLAVIVLDTPNPDKDLFVIAIAEDAVLAQHKAEIKGIFNSIKPMK